MEIFMEALSDTAKLVPLLAVIYFLIGFLEYKYGDNMTHYITHMGVWAPVAGALVGCVPQCGFSVIASALYVKRLISTGTLLAVFLSTSDEAIPVLLSMPSKAEMVGLLIVIKIVIGIVGGVVVDYAIKVHSAVRAKNSDHAESSYNEAVKGHPGCCYHGISGDRPRIKMLFLHPLMHTVKIFFFLLFVSVIFNLFVAKVGISRIDSLLFRGTIFQPALASLVGLMPNCFASVLLAQLFSRGAISFGAMVAGLSAGSGLGLLVLIKENKDMKNTFFVIGLLLSISIFSGIVIQYIKLI